MDELSILLQIVLLLNDYRTTKKQRVGIKSNRNKMKRKSSQN